MKHPSPFIDPADYPGTPEYDEIAEELARRVYYTEQAKIEASQCASIDLILFQK